MAQLETRGRRLYLEHGKVLMMKTWATLIFTNRNRASEEVRESSERVDKNSTNQRTLEVKKKMRTEDQPSETAERSRRTKKLITSMDSALVRSVRFLLLGSGCWKG